MAGSGAAPRDRRMPEGVKALVGDEGLEPPASSV